MTYTAAKRLHNEDEVIIKATGVALHVVETEVNTEDKSVIILCDDGCQYHHTEVR